MEFLLDSWSEGCNFDTVTCLMLQQTKDEAAVLWLEEIQAAIEKANKDAEDAQKCKHSLLLSDSI